MLRVLLVDDERLARHYVCSLIDWERHGFVIVGEAEGGIEAMRAIDRNRPHIAVIDMNMPVMDGVALCRYLHEYHPDMKVIVLSSYDKYEYVRETLKNGAVDYLLKHRLDEESLLQVLEKARSDIGSAAAAAGAGPASDASEREPAPSLLAVAEWLQGLDACGDSVRGWLERRWSRERARNGFAAVMQIANFRLLTETLPDGERTGLVRSIVDLCEQSGTGDPSLMIPVPLARGDIALLFYCDGSDERAVVRDAEERLGRIEYSIDLYLGMKAVFGIGPPVRQAGGVRDSFRKAAGNAEERMRQLHAGPSGAGARTDGEKPASLTLGQEKAIRNAVEARDVHAVGEALDGIVRSLREGPASARSIQGVLSELLAIADKFWQHRPERGCGPEPDDWASRGELTRLFHLDDLLQWLKERYRRLIERLVPDSDRPIHSAVIKEAVLYVRENYPDDISLELTARRIGVTPAYLSHLFKEETGTSFTEYLNRLRVGRSKRLIEDGESRIKDIYGKAGFASYNYFFKVFKQYEGVTPSVYLKRRLEQNG
ncbi:response regulator [Cohnella zeiphila]|uniref:Response regulator n=1 Tax=Cohnella zeiphila TaxID=2761120 RepID=A0A7X0SSU5_9BACL|nr:response regulator [Cohnella zeiphila]MBB6733248.1 response regulator [Cohnella zeiphila]